MKSIWYGLAVFQSKFRMENDAQLEQGRFTFNDIHRYLRDGYTKPDKLALRKRAKFFCTRGADLIYVGGSSSKFLSSTYVYVSAFVGTFRSSVLQQRTALPWGSNHIW